MVMPIGEPLKLPPGFLLTTQQALEQPLVGLEELLLGPAKALQEGIHQLNATASRSGLPQLPEAPTPPRLFGGDNPGHRRRGY